MRQILLGLAIFLLFSTVADAAQISGANYTVAQANATITSAYSYVNSINESGYLIFQPNLNASYSYLSMALKIYNSSPDTAVFYAQQAETLAQQQYSNINYYRSRSLPVIVAFTLLMLIVLYKIMVPIGPVKKVRRRFLG